MNRVLANRALALLIVALVAADWLTKLWITNALALDETLALVDGWIYFVRRENTGVAFSMLADLPATWRVPLLSLVGFLGILLFSRIIGSTTDRWARLAGAAVIGGAVGNLGDRMLTGGVTDFVFLAFLPYVFNFADTVITLGGSVLAVRLAIVEDVPRPAGDTKLGHA
jgi:signal peptidase II